MTEATAIAFDDGSRVMEQATDTSAGAPLSRGADFDLLSYYDVETTVVYIHDGGYRRVALQFPDELLPDAPALITTMRGMLAARARAAQVAAQAQTTAQAQARAQGAAGAADAAAASVGDTAADAAAAAGAAGALTIAEGAAAVASEPSQPASLFILGDTSYGSCCVDEVAAQHLDADIVVHYGRACLTPTTHLATIWVLGKERVDVGKCAAAFGSSSSVRPAPPDAGDARSRPPRQRART